MNIKFWLVDVGVGMIRPFTLPPVLGLESLNVSGIVVGLLVETALELVVSMVLEFALSFH